MPPHAVWRCGALVPLTARGLGRIQSRATGLRSCHSTTRCPRLVRWRPSDGDGSPPRRAHGTAGGHRHRHGRPGAAARQLRAARAVPPPVGRPGVAAGQHRRLGHPGDRAGLHGLLLGPADRGVPEHRAAPRRPLPPGDAARRRARSTSTRATASSAASTGAGTDRTASIPSARSSTCTAAATSARRRACTGSSSPRLARRTRCEIFVADYRLAPEFPFPAGLEDAVVVMRELQADGGSPRAPLRRRRLRRRRPGQLAHDGRRLRRPARPRRGCCSSRPRSTSASTSRR